MKRLVPAFAIVLGWVTAAWAAAPAPLTSLRAVRALSNAEARQALPAAFEATVTYFPGYEDLLFVQDSDLAIFVLANTSLKLVPGDRVLVKGTTAESFRPIVTSNDITLLRHGDLPKPAPVTFDDLIAARYDCMLVTVHAVVRTANLRFSPTARVTSLELQLDGGYIDATVDSDNPKALTDLLDAEVQVTGVAGGKFDSKMQQTGAVLHVSSLRDVKILKRPGAGPWSLPVTPMDQVLSSYHVQDLTRRVKVHGTITYYQPGTAVVLQDGAKSLWIATPTRNPLRIGDLADATGFPEAHNGFLTLSHGEIQDGGVQAPIAPQPATWRQLAFWSSNKPVGRQYDLVSIEGQVVSEVREAAQDEYVVLSDDRLFTAVYNHPDAASQIPLPAMNSIELGSRVSVVGICMIEGTNPFNTSVEVPFDILMRTPTDIAAVARPSPLSVRNLILLVGLLVAVVFAFGARGWFIERRVRSQTAALAYLERRRSRILEDINGSRPLAEIVEQITELVSYKLHGAPCWCQIAGGALLGNCPPKLANLRVVEEEIPARSGPPLGSIYAGFDPRAKLSSDESEALAMAVGLATLAIETRRLYTDLRHRSEFDQLTDIHNRFSMEKYLDALIEEARQNAGIFGLIYIDLNQFKQINDLYGHHVGDLYLQEVSVRMKRQLRSADQLARLGGDEFAVLVPAIHSRAEVEEIALRLERSFDEPFAYEGYVLHGSASMGLALYPEDGATKDSLLIAADAAMYVSKNTRRQREEVEVRSKVSESTRGKRN